jgi:hypothetical protein
VSRYDPGLKYQLTDRLLASDLAADPALLRATRAAIAADLDDYPGTLVWTETFDGGVLTITGTKYPPDLADEIIARRRAGWREESAA